MEKYGVLDIYDEDPKKRYIIDNEDINYTKREGMYLVGITNEPSTNHIYFSNIEDLCGRILATHNNGGMKLKKSANMYPHKPTINII